MARIPVLFRFSLYGFLKNQQYYDPFIILAFREKGLSFFMIGLLMAFRDIFINIFEIPSGAIADLYGRRISMILSFVAYIISFLIFGGCRVVWLLFAAMYFFAIGEAFRTGTHKAMIFTWLRNNDRLADRTKTYGYTRSWSKIGSAVSVVVATALVFYTGNYSAIFYWCIIPYVLNIINFMGYPKEVDIERDKKVSMVVIVRHLWDSFVQMFHEKDLRRLLIEDIGFEGTFNTVKDYLQPILKSAAVALPILVFLNTQKRSAILIGIVYCILYILSSIASRRAHELVERAGGEEQAARWLWCMNLIMFGILTPLLYTGHYLGASGCFVLMAILQNFWRPVIITRIDHHSKEESGATILSIESQSRTFFNMLMAPVLGMIVDHLGFGPIGVLGLMITLLVMVMGKRSILEK
ncbi:MAG: MFS transporter [bacterium]